MGGRKVPNLVLRDLDEIANRSLNAHCFSNISGDFKFEGFRILREPEPFSIFASKIYFVASSVRSWIREAAGVRGKDHR